MQGSALRNFQMFQEICGDTALGNVVLLTTMWDKLVNEMDGLDRDQELREDFWSLMEEKGSYIARFDGSTEMAEAMIGMLLAKKPIVLGIQKELQDEGKRLEETSAGRLLVPELDAKLDRCNKHIEYLEARIREADRQKDREQKKSLEKRRREYAEQKRREEQERQKLRINVARETEDKIRKERKPASNWRDRLQVFTTITGVAVSVVLNLLPVLS